MGLYFPWGSHIVIVQSEVAWKWREIRCGMNRNSPKTHEVVATTMQRYLYIFTFYTALIGSNGINFVIINMSTIKDWSIFERYDAEESFVFIGVRNSSAKLYCLDYTYKVQKQLRISLFFITFECSACMNRTRSVGSNFTLFWGGGAQNSLTDKKKKRTQKKKKRRSSDVIIEGAQAYNSYVFYGLISWSTYTFFFCFQKKQT